jgi:hypothetical protein
VTVNGTSTYHAFERSSWLHLQGTQHSIGTTFISNADSEHQTWSIEAIIALIALCVTLPLSGLGLLQKYRPRLVRLTLDFAKQQNQMTVPEAGNTLHLLQRRVDHMPMWTLQTLRYVSDLTRPRSWLG